MSVKIKFEQVENPTPPILSDCELQSISIRPDNTGKKQLFRDEACGTDVSTSDKYVGPSLLKVNMATRYEFQKLNATQIHRAINDPKLGQFLQRIYPLLKEELDDSDLFNKLL